MKKPQQKQLELVEKKRHWKKVLSIVLVVIVCFVGVLLAVFTPSLIELLAVILYALLFTLVLLVFVIPVAFILFFVKDAAKKTRFLLIFLGVSLGGCFGYWLDGRFGYLLGGVVVGGLVAFLLTKPKEPTLAKAASRGNIEAAQKHIAAGTGVNAKDNDGTTTLDSADAETVDLLCKHGDNNKKEQKTVGKSDDESYRSVPSLEAQHSEPVSESSQQEPIMVESSNSEANRSLFDAAKSGNIETFKQHLAAGADVNVKGSTLLGHDVSPLHEAAGWGHKEFVELLIAKGADVNAKDAEGKTPSDSGTGEISDLLRKHGGKTGEELKAEGK